MTRRLLPWQSVVSKQAAQMSSLKSSRPSTVVRPEHIVLRRAVSHGEDQEKDRDREIGGAHVSSECAFHHIKADNLVDKVLMQPHVHQHSRNEPSRFVAPRPPPPAAVRLPDLYHVAHYHPLHPIAR
jgi:hypothetical protein